MNKIKNILRIIKNFFIGPRLDIGYFPEYNWKWKFGGHFEMDWAPGWHFDQLGFTFYFGSYTFYAYWVDNN